MNRICKECCKNPSQLIITIDNKANRRIVDSRICGECLYKREVEDYIKDSERQLVTSKQKN